MKAQLPIVLFILLINSVTGFSQLEKIHNVMFRVQEDNDFINLRGKGTDEAYTNGIRLEIFYVNNNASFIPHFKVFPNAGPNSENTHSWGIAQLMYTPRNISTAEPDPNDFPYAGVFLVSRSLHSVNPIKQISFNTQIEIGFTGPISFAKEAQIAIHRLIKYQRPMGWEHQLPAQGIVNLNFAFETKIIRTPKWIEVIGGTQISVGNFLDNIALQSQVIFGKMKPYFDGFIQRFSSFDNSDAKNLHWQASFLFRPRVEYQFYNAITTRKRNGGVKREVVEGSESNRQVKEATPSHFIAGFDYGMSLVCEHNSIAITQKVESASIQGLRHHEVGNISYTKTW